MMTKKEMYSIPLQEFCTEKCEVLLLLPRGKDLSLYRPPSVERMEMVRRLVADAARQTRKAL
jgi:hypothetical protein